jgi:hypothetical protein
MTTASQQKRGRSFVGGLIPPSSQKTRATAEARTKERHFYKPLHKEFRRNGFNYRQIARQGGVALYEQTWSSCDEPSRSYEVIRIRRRDGFRIEGRFVEPAEVYPASELWGVDGFTFADRDKAWDKFFEISLEEPARNRKEVKNGKIV